ncbi:malonate decarboxylase holo-ACP synthase [Streptomyces sp. NPDC055037]
MPHDLVLVPRPSALRAPDGGDLPDAAMHALAVFTGADDAWVVVRRSPARPGHLAVGIRGTSRSARFAAEVAHDEVTSVLRPWQLTNTSVDAQRADLAAFTALRQLRQAAPQAGAATTPRWGPGGSVGFELASGHPTVTGTSDLDIVVDGSDERARTGARRLLAYALACADVCRIDTQVQIDRYAFALAELIHAAGRPVAVRTPTGPVLTRDPWRPRR